MSLWRHALVAAVLLGYAAPARAQTQSPADAGYLPNTPPDADACVSTPENPLLPDSLVREPENYLVIGVAAEAFASTQSEHRSTNNNLLYGLAAMWRLKSFGPHLVLMTKPATDNYQNSRFLAGGGLRGYFKVPGVTEFSYGVGTHIEARLEDHYWLAFATPVELGATVYRRGSWHIDVFLGARRAMAGELINHFLIDPNGIDNENAKDDLYRARHVEPWKGFLRVVFSRRID
jgi:hypothetical protein